MAESSAGLRFKNHRGKGRQVDSQRGATTGANLIQIDRNKKGPQARGLRAKQPDLVVRQHWTYRRRNKPLSKASTASTMKIKKSICAIDAAPAAMPPKPSTAAMIAITKNTTA